MDFNLVGIHIQVCALYVLSAEHCLCLHLISGLSLHPLVISSLLVPNVILEKSFVLYVLITVAWALLLGSGSGHNGTPLAAIGDIVVVSINYRLGLLGTETRSLSTLHLGGQSIIL